MTIQERLKRKRQALLNKQCKTHTHDLIKTVVIQLMFLVKADKIAEKIKTEREKQEQQTREDELREMAIKLRKRLLKPLMSISCNDINVFISIIDKGRNVTRTRAIAVQVPQTAIRT